MSIDNTPVRLMLWQCKIVRANCCEFVWRESDGRATRCVSHEGPSTHGISSAATVARVEPLLGQGLNAMKKELVLHLLYLERDLYLKSVHLDDVMDLI